jgi:hypothetical protein
MRSGVPSEIGVEYGSGASGPHTCPRGQSVIATAEPPVTITGVTEILRLPGDGADSYRVTLETRSTRSEPVNLEVLGLEIGDRSVWSLPRQLVVRPGGQRLTLVAGGTVGQGRLTLRYDLDGHRHQVSAELSVRSL